MEIGSFLGREFLCGECGERHRIALRYIEEGTVEGLGPFLEGILGADKKVLLLADNITWEAAGEQCKKSIEEKCKFFPVVLNPEGEKRVTARAEYLGKIAEKSQLADIILTVGTGTVTDLGKLTGNTLKKPVLCFPTAPSMNGYTSPVAAYLKDGLKLTVPVTPAYGVFFDPGILEKSPLDLIKSGFADSLAKSFANADWKISSLITGEEFCSLPYRIVGESEKNYVDKGDLLLKKDRQTVQALMNALNLGGISMIIAGKSSPASGGEHLISHFLDMYSHKYREEVFAYHGIQVGAGVFISALLYEAMKDLTVSGVKSMLAETRIDYNGYLQKLISMFPESADPIKREFDEKMRQIAILREVLPEKWEDVRREAFGMVYPPGRISGIYGKADIPLHLKEIAADEKIIYNALMLARFIRGRLTVLDIAGETGMLESFAEKYREMSR